MGVNVIGNMEEAAFVCDTSDTAFGPVHYSHDGTDAREFMWDFMNELPQDPRVYTDEELATAYYDYREERYPEQYGTDAVKYV